jgi:hypothetical protein
MQSWKNPSPPLSTPLMYPVNCLDDICFRQIDHRAVTWQHCETNVPVLQMPTAQANLDASGLLSSARVVFEGRSRTPRAHPIRRNHFSQLPLAA